MGTKLASIFVREDQGSISQKISAAYKKRVIEQKNIGQIPMVMVDSWFFVSCLFEGKLQKRRVILGLVTM